jgi:hypothetical protein
MLKQLVDIHGTGNCKLTHFELKLSSHVLFPLGTLIAQSLPERTGKQCRERFHNHLDVGIKKGDWTVEEDRIIIILQRSMGNQWAKVNSLL